MFRGAFWVGAKFAVSVFGLITTGTGLFNMVVDWFDLSISPLIEPLIDLYLKFIPALYDWIEFRVEWMVPDWPPDLITIAIMQAVLAARAILAYDESDKSGVPVPVKVYRDGRPVTIYIDPKSGFKYQLGIVAIQLAVVFSSICVPYVRYPASIFIAIWSLFALIKAFQGPLRSGPEFVTVYGIGNRRLVLAGRYIWGCIFTAAALLFLNAYQ
jgi:hypothetical protein